MGKRVDAIRILVRKRIVLSPENGQVLLDEIDRLKAALAPFGDHGIGEYTADNEEVRVYFDGSGQTNLTVGDIRRAEKAFKGE